MVFYGEGEGGGQISSLWSVKREKTNMRLVSIQVGCPEEIHDYWLLEIPDDWDLESMEKNYWAIVRPKRLLGEEYPEFFEFLKERGAKELHFERFNAD